MGRFWLGDLGVVLGPGGCILGSWLVGGLHRGALVGGDLWMR